MKKYIRHWRFLYFNKLRYTKRFLIICLLLQLTSFLSAPAQERLSISGKVLSAVHGGFLEGATISLNESIESVKTDKNGNFQLSTALSQGTIKVTYIGYQAIEQRFNAKDKLNFDFVLQAEEGVLEEVQVNTGYQTLPKERGNGSFDVVDNNLLNRGVSTDILKRLENITPGLLFNHGDAENTDPFLIRGRSTITAEAQPLIILDDFPYEGDLNNINPNDVESVSILKDAAAASIWGARAGNGVIVITSKKGKSATPRIQINSNITFQGKPDLYNVNRLSPTEQIEIERFLFSNGRYDGAKESGTLAQRTTPIPEAVELMIANPIDLEEQLRKLGSHDVRDDIAKYFYQSSVRQQHSFNLSGSQDKINYYLSSGFDRNVSNLVGEDYQRFSLRTSNTFQVNDKLQFNATINYSQIVDKAGNNKGMRTSSTPFRDLSYYSRLADPDGDSLPVFLDYREGYLYSMRDDGKLLDWIYKPIDEISEEQHNNHSRDYLVSVGGKHEIINGLNVDLKYQFQNQSSKKEDLFSEQSYYVRDMINRYTQVDETTGLLSYPIPLGSILNINTIELKSHQGRAQLNFQRKWNEKHEIISLAGFEIRSLITEGDNNHRYGYNENNGGINKTIDYITRFKQTPSGSLARIDNLQSVSKLTDNFISYYSNAAYTFDNRFTFSGSIRKDEANLFGVKANQKGTPLWSVGGAWSINNENFYNINWLPYLKLRTSYGVSGNISRRANAQPIIFLSSSGWLHPNPSATVGSPPNENLSWERVKMLNIGIDFSTLKNKVSGTVELYRKNAVDLLSQMPMDPTLGVNSMFVNVANVSGKGIDAQINTQTINRKFKWFSSFVFSYSVSKVTEYLMPQNVRGRVYLPISLSNPHVGRPLYSVYSFAWRGLDSETGAPIGYVDGKETMDYNVIYNSTTLEGMVFHGSAQPKTYGAIRNSFSYRNVDLSFNISYKLGYYFRRQSVLYGVVFNGLGHGDFSKRWQRTGDEKNTDVPSMVYPAVASRDNFYQYAEVLVEKADHIRLEDINLSYTIIPKGQKFNSIRVFAYASNLGLLWKANSKGIDPYYNNTILTKPNYSIGATLIF